MVCSLRCSQTCAPDLETSLRGVERRRRRDFLREDPGVPGYSEERVQRRVVETEIGVCERAGREEVHELRDVGVDGAGEEVIWIMQVFAERKLGGKPAH